MSFAFVVGDKVILKARPDAGSGVISEVLLAGAEPQYEVFFSSGTQMYSARHLDLAPTGAGTFDSPADRLAAGELSDADAFRGFMSLVKLETPLANNLYSFAASRTERLPHQFKAVLKLLANPHGRLLIADEVGLGKTIEAGIVLTELGARRPLDHVLVACPSPLTQKWRREMRDRFLLDFEIVDGPSLREFASADVKGPAPEPRHIIASLELLRRAENLETLVSYAPHLDVVVVDEAHHLRNVGTASNALGDVLTSLAETLVFLTATPLNLGRDDFFQLMHLLVPDEFPQYDAFADSIEPNAHVNLALRHLRARWPPDFAQALDALRQVEHTSLQERFRRSARYVGVRHGLEAAVDGAPTTREDAVGWQRDLLELNALSHVFTRTRKREVQEQFPTRRSATVAVTFSSEEAAFYDAVTAWVLETYKDRAAHLVATTFQRLAASCLPALGRRLADVVRTQTIQLDADELPELLDDPAAEETFSDQLDEDTVTLSVAEPSAIERLLTTWDAYRGRVDAKYDGFVEALTASFSAGAYRILVFSYFTGTIDYLAERLAQVRIGERALQVLKLYGPMNAEQRDLAVAEFRDSPGPIVLLSSEVGSEGLDFQFCARMFNYDLPWNPMRVEQRIGRLDRFGQRSALIHIHNLIVSETIEERIFYRLYDRIRIFESSIGDLEAILGDVETDLGKLQRDALSGRLSEAEIDRRRNQIADAIVRRQQDDEVFEDASKQLLSNDDVFLEQFNDIEKSRRYVTPEELRLLLERFLAVSGTGSRLAASGQSGVFRLAGGIGQLRTQLSRALARSAGGAKPARAFLSRLRDEGMELTFDPAIATSQRSLEFVSLHHPLIRALAESADLRAELSACGALELDIELPARGANPFFIFELQASGLKDEIELVPAVIGLDGNVDEGGSAQLLGALDTARTGEVGEIPSAETVHRSHEQALTWIAAVVAAREQDLHARNEETIGAQIESLRVSIDRRRLWLQEQIQEGRSEPIVRMRRSQLSRLESEFDAKLDTLESKRGVTVGYRLVAAGLVTSPATR